MSDISPAIRRINDTPMDQLRFRDFLQLKSGRDAYSALRGAKLWERIDSSVRTQIEERIVVDAARAAAARWVLRGLAPDRAIRKVLTDAEVSANAMGARDGRRSGRGAPLDNAPDDWSDA